MKVSALIFVCIVAVAVSVVVAIPVQPEYGVESKLTLADLENEQNNVNAVADENGNIAREKRFILKKLALAKLAHLGLGALGIAGAALATKGVLKTVLDFPSHYSYRASPRLSVSYPNGAYQYSQYFR
ncbi:uncharacterized protein LOC116342913 [Contarinia nasturtii]|uniref:uncharacterized protein LOC116342913 n=1 Tax=Contarinia nasturtii TaxID=265458 RepID=UPI0012D3ABB7|nr:uncharacterized protein LOC116342913 [Contarinia nasturtii]